MKDTFFQYVLFYNMFFFNYYNRLQRSKNMLKKKEKKRRNIPKKGKIINLLKI